MGYQDRDYYRDGSRGSFWLLSGTAPACKAIIAINVGVFLLGKFLPGDTLHNLFAAVSSLIFHKGEVWRLLTAAFLHNPDNIWHLAGNMLFLWFIGRDMEAFYGTREFWWLYLSAAVVSTLVWAVVDSYLGHYARAYGASGAVMTVVALYTFYHPRRQVILFIFQVEMWVVLTLFIANDALGLLGQSAQPIAFAGHLGGFAYAVAYKVFDLRLKHLTSLFSSAGRRPPKLRIVTDDAPPREATAPRPTASSPSGPSRSPGTATSARPAPSPVVSEETLEARLDEILGKIAREGSSANLTEEERRILDEASRRAQKRRSERV